VKFEPLKITAKMGGSIGTYNGQIMLDGCLEQVAWRLAGRKQYSMGSPADTYEIPLARFGDGDGPWVWCCSTSIAEWIFDEIQYKNRQFPFGRARLLKADQRKITVSSGPNKSFRLPIPKTFATEVTWYCVGDFDLISAMLNHIHYLGKEHNRGMGKVLEWVVERVDYDYSLFDGDGKPNRPIPVDLRIGCDPYDFSGMDGFQAYVGYRAPYWHPDRKALCYMSELGGGS